MFNFDLLKNDKNRKFLPYIFLLIFIIPLLFINGHQQSLIAHDEGLYATRAKLMFDTGNWINPWDNAHHKTPGIYWIIFIFYHLLGVNETAVRLPIILFSIGCLFLLYEITKIILNQRVAFIAALILNLQFLWLRYSRVANPDLGAIFFVLLGIFCFLKAEKVSKYNNLLILGAGISFSLGFLLRSFMIFVPIIALIPYLIFEHHRHKHLKNFWLYIGLFLGLIPTLFWIISDFYLYQNNNIQSLIDLIFNFGSNQRENHKLFFYFWNIPALSFPWIIFSILGIIYCFKRKIKNYQWLILETPLIIMAELSLFSTRLSHYSLVIFPFLAILASLGLDWLINNQDYDLKIYSKLLAIISYFFAFLGGAIFLGSISILLNSQLNIIQLDHEFIKYAIVAIALGIAWSILPFVYKKKSKINLWLTALIIGNWLAFINLGFMGFLTDVNPDVKEFVTRPEIANILENNPVQLINEKGKIKVLLKFYTPNLKQDFENTNNLPSNLYCWINSQQIPQLKLPFHSFGNLRDWQLIQTK